MFSNQPNPWDGRRAGRGVRDFVAAGISVQRAKETLRPLINPIRYKFALRFQRRQNRIYTQFRRFPNQLRVLTEHVLPAMLERDPTLAQRPLRIAVFACCSGEEVVSLSHSIRTAFPQLSLRIQAYDLVGEVVERAQTGCYSKEEVYAGPFVSDDFVQQVFEVENETYRVKPALREGVTFETGDITSEAFMGALEPFDLVFAQNVLFHLPRPVARRAFHNLAGLLRPGGALFINGMDSDMRIELTKAAKLTPVETLIEEIHNDARVDRGGAWAHQYWGREPFSRSGADWTRRHGTIFTSGA